MEALLNAAAAFDIEAIIVAALMLCMDGVVTLFGWVFG